MKILDYIDYCVEGKDVLHDTVHTHVSSYELLHIMQGNGTFLIGEIPYRLHENAVYIIKPLSLHGSNAGDQRNYIRSKLSIPAERLDKLLDSVGLRELTEELFDKNGGAYIALSKEASEKIDLLFRQMALYEKENNVSDNARMMMQLIEILLICRENKQNETRGHELVNSLVSQIISYINSNISSELTIDGIAGKMFISKYYLCRAFKKALGLSVMKYILNQRLSLAKVQLINSNKKISDIAMETGFSGFSYFCRVFKEVEGVSPGEYRQNKQKNLQK